jgi:16S rRNA (guanine966-N2)-methyltransferase
MRVIAGTARSIPLKTIEGIETRPTTDRIKETLFNMIQSDILGCYFLDLFAGSGQIGIEALSRGAAYAVFVESGKKAAACVADNIHFTKFEDKCQLLRMEAIAGIRSLEGKYTFDYIFMDPPYNRELEKEVLTALQSSSILKCDTIVIVEAALNTDFSYLNDLGYEIIKEKNYKTNMHLFVRKKNR